MTYFFTWNVPLGNPSHPANIATPATRPTCFLHHLLHYPCTKALYSCQAALLCSGLSKHLRLLLFLVVSGRVGSSTTLMRCTSPTKASHSSNVLIEGERPPSFSQCNELKEKQMLVHCIGKDFHQEQFHQVSSFSRRWSPDGAAPTYRNRSKMTPLSLTTPVKDILYFLFVFYIHI